MSLRKNIFITLILLGFCSASVPVTTLIEQGKDYDKKNVEIQGEVIGDILKHKHKTWINVLSPEGMAIGVACSDAQAAQIKHVGNYKCRGDIVFVRGIFYRFAQAESGETMIEAQDVRIVQPGQEIVHKINLKRFLIAGIISILVLLSTGSLILRRIRYYLVVWTRRKPRRNYM